MARPKSETRRLTEIVSVRFSPADLDALRLAAMERNLTVPQLLRDVTLDSVRAAS